MKIIVLFLCAIVQILAADSQIEDFTTATRLSSADLYNELLLDNNDNFAASAFSLETLFAVLQSGAVDKTGDEIRQILHFPSTKEETEDLLKSSLPVIQSDFHTLAAVTKMYIQGGSLNEDFENVAAEAYSVIFQKGDPATSKIELDGAFKVVLSNDVSFRSEWEVPFETGGSGVFYIDEDTKVSSVTMVKDSEEANYFESEELDAKILELPLSGESTLTIVLPNQKEGIAVLEKDIEQVLTTPKFTKESVRIEIPRFKIASSIDLTEAVKNLGIQTIFDSDSADLSGISGSKGDISLNKLQQNVLIDINENGIGGAVDTQINAYKISTSSADKVFIADHPFIFYIKVQGVIIYEGRLVNPAM